MASRTLRTDEGATALIPGTCAGFPTGTGNAHHLVNETDTDVVYLEIGDRTPGDSAVWPDDDLQVGEIAGRDDEQQCPLAPPSRGCPTSGFASCRPSLMSNVGPHNAVRPKGTVDVITVFGEGRGFRVVWLLEEMGLPYKLRRVDLQAGVENDAEYLAINPAGFIPAIQDGDVTMVESIAIMEYLMARHGPTTLAPAAKDPAFPAYQQFLHLGEAGLAASIYFVNVSRNLAPEPERQNWGAQKALEVFNSRLKLVSRQLARSPYMAGDAFTAADISVTYALELAQRGGSVALGEAEQAYVTRTSRREGYKRAMDACHDTRAWAAKVASRGNSGAGKA